ncbi:MAG: osmoprotectant ABC transporter substrate-binding protein [Liquorilactobacillus nagelii]|jgi:osmoprotectant transport system substrate-binding protein|uniref:Osmoprotectant ABC transporter substrate-binding protein n=2 Tax=Liquorilactobacillus nagelii TaxID=82688 RepID=A0A3Q8D048_9LACO|nr:osmoprotectant ABC transporter substrate-binding protein [Liquorilactobacillus nagelii]AUJ31734.1 osmoprotectant ABC transporter substrate-binding protein [Liquorilactobacillus nagelii]KRL41326.1 periplasmic glycine betaine choline-binding (lipo)protein of an ABC-type transport system [Liquorilactobacillus nagelii DSM 13675]MCC7615894.1 osmoprotectant ABC transporter substrate-binding protein [Liquorilactobacillus nagelii]MCI1633052.1 osmoprotectant ABC transporter substrate-binding protein 
MKLKILLKRRIVYLSLLLGLVMLGGCGLPGVSGTSNSQTIRIASQSTTESQIMANIIAELIQHELGYQTTLVNNLGSSTVAHQALLRGDADISATRYTGTDLTGTLQMDNVKDPKKATAIVTKQFKKRFNQTWFPSYGFADTYAFMTTKKFAAKYHLKTISDLQTVAGQLNAGVDSSWMNRKGDGYDDFAKDYGFRFKRVSPMQIGLVYDAVEAGKMQVVLGYSTDGRIKSYNLQLLKDNKRFFPPYNCSMVVNDSLLKKYPKLAPVLHRLDGKINLKTMQSLNYQADNNLQEPAVVAHNFLVKHNYFRGGND